MNIVTIEPGEALGDYLARAQGDLRSLTSEVERLTEALAREPARLDRQRDYDTTLARLSSVSLPGALRQPSRSSASTAYCRQRPSPP